MYRQMSRAQREAAFLEKAAHMYSAFEDWYDQHLEASFGEIEAEARRLRRRLMGEGLVLQRKVTESCKSLQLCLSM